MADNFLHYTTKKFLSEKLLAEVEIYDEIVGQIGNPKCEKGFFIGYGGNVVLGMI